MNNRAIVAVLVTVLLYAAFSWKSVKDEEYYKIKPEGSSFLSQPRISHSKEGFKQSEPVQHGQASSKQAVPIEEDVTVAAAGPNSPVPRPRESDQQIVILKPEEPYDPDENSFESAEIPERLRYPERAYGPGLVNDEQRMSVQSGIASDAHQITQKAYQVFGPEFVQNGAMFMENGVMANDVEVPSNYSSV